MGALTLKSFIFELRGKDRKDLKIFSLQMVFDLILEFQNYLNWDMLFFLMLIFSFGSIIGWRFIFSIIKKPSSLKQVLANQYIFFLVSILNHTKVPTRFIMFTLTLGLFLGRQLIRLYKIPYPQLFVVLSICPFLTFFICYILLYGYFLLSLQYPAVFGRYLIDFFEINASKEVLSLIGLEKRSSNKKKSKNS